MMAGECLPWGRWCSAGPNRGRNAHRQFQAAGFGSPTPRSDGDANTEMLSRGRLRPCRLQHRVLGPLDRRSRQAVDDDNSGFVQPRRVAGCHHKAHLLLGASLAVASLLEFDRAVGRVCAAREASNGHRLVKEHDLNGAVGGRHRAVDAKHDQPELEHDLSRMSHNGFHVWVNLPLLRKQYLRPARSPSMTYCESDRNLMGVGEGCA